MTFEAFLNVLVKVLEKVPAHLFMVVAALMFTIIVGVPLGICAYYFPKVRRVILKVVEILQTIPAMALLGVIMVFLGPGQLTVIIGLLLYSLLPVVLNTYVGLSEVDPAIKEAATGIGMTRMNRLVQVEVPIAFPLIFTGVRIAMVTSIGVAVFAAFVGGGGLGSIIYESIRVSNMTQLLSATVVLMGMAILFDFVMGQIEKRLQRKLTGRRQA